MWLLTLVAFALTAGFFAGTGVDVPVDLLPLLAMVTAGFLAVKALEQRLQI